MNLILQKTVSIGIKSAPKKEHKKIKILNGLCLLLIITISLLLIKDFFFAGFNLVHKNLGFNFLLLTLAILIIYLQYKVQIQFARILFILICILYACVFSFLEPGSLVEQNFIIIPIISLAFISNKWINITILIVCFFLHYFCFKNIDVYENINYQIPQMLTHFIGNFMILMYTQNLNKKQEKILEKQRDLLLSDKIILEKQEAELRELNEFKSHFFVNLSHEIRTPITLIKGYTNTINLSDNIHVTKNKLTVIDTQIKQIENILNNILDLSKLDASKLKIDRKTYNISILLNKLYADYKTLFDKKNIDFKLLTTNTSISINMDINLVEKAINNLINNALKFTPKNGKVILQTVLTDDVTISVSDNGIGIPRDDLDNVFNRFYQSKNDITQSEGSGIGLSFTKSILDAHGFSIKATSIPNINTTFLITIPKEYINFTIIEEKTTIKPKVEEKRISIKSSNINKNLATILIVDDHEQMRNYLLNILTDYKVLEAENGKEAFEILKKKKIDLLLTDYMMPIINGEELVKKVKKLNFKIPIIVLTARTDNFAKLNMLRIGVDSYLNKPFDEEELKLHIKNSLQRYKNIIEENEKLSNYEKNTLDKYAEDFNNKTLGFINKNLSKAGFSVQDVANHLNISQSTLTRRTKSIFGLTAQEFILQVKLEKARALFIDQPYLTKQQISYQVGIYNASYLFKKLEENYGKNFLKNAKS